MKNVKTLVRHAYRWLPLVSIVIVSSLSVAAPGQRSDGSQLPPDYPRLRFALNPLYHSVGLKLGHVLNFRRERMVLRTYEGELMLGFGTNSASVDDRVCAQLAEREGSTESGEECNLFTNPWHFSFLDRQLYNDLSQIGAAPVVIYYVNYYAAPSHFLTKTRNKALAAFYIQPDLKIDRSYKISSWTNLHPEAGQITGRIVQASVESPIRKTYEVIIQEAENADNFRAMTVSDAKLFRYITYAMLTGRPLQIEYVRLHPSYAKSLSFLFNFMTAYRVISVTIL